MGKRKAEDDGRCRKRVRGTAGEEEEKEWKGEEERKREEGGAWLKVQERSERKGRQVKKKRERNGKGTKGWDKSEGQGEKCAGTVEVMEERRKDKGDMDRCGG